MIDSGNNGGASRDRTDDPLLAKQVLSQLSYGPELDLFSLCGVMLGVRSVTYWRTLPLSLLRMPCSRKKSRRFVIFPDKGKYNEAPAFCSATDMQRISGEFFR